MTDKEKKMDDLIHQGHLTEQQLKALYDPIRIRIASCLKVPHTPRQVAGILNIRSNNLYHHFRVLQKAGVIELVETKKGKGFIKEDYFRLALKVIGADSSKAPNLKGQQMLFGLFQALLDDFKTTASRHDKPFALGVREDFRFSKQDLEKAKKIVEKHCEQLRKEISALSDPAGTPNYQLSVFSYRV